MFYESCFMKLLFGEFWNQFVKKGRLIHRNKMNWSFSFPPGGTLDSGSASCQYWLCGGTIQEVPIVTGGAPQLPEDRAEPGHQERGIEGSACHFKSCNSRCNSKPAENVYLPEVVKCIYYMKIFQFVLFIISNHK